MDCLYLSLDTSLFWDEYCLVRLAVVHRVLALPIVWRVVEHRSASVAFSDYREMLYQAVGRLPKSVKVVLLADRGFIHTELMQAAITQLGWHYVPLLVNQSCRFKSALAAQNWCKPKSLERASNTLIPRMLLPF